MYGHYIYSAVAGTHLPKIWTCHNVPPQEYRSPWSEEAFVGKILNTIYAKAVSIKHQRLIRSYPYDRIVAVSEATARLLTEKVRLSKQCVRVIANGVRLINMYSNSNMAADGTIRILTVGGIKKHKGIHHLPQVAQKLLQKGIDFEWTLVGPSDNYDYEEALRRNINALGLTSRIRWKGILSKDDLDNHYRDTHLYVHMANQEGFCLTVLEALATGVPVVGTNVGAIPEMIQHGTGIVVESNPESIADGIIAAIKDYASFTKGNKLAQIIQARYGWKEIAKQTKVVYQSVLKDNYSNYNSRRL
jgi:glycosyltransferase involved in cell wall biosynthesis